MNMSPPSTSNNSVHGDDDGTGSMAPEQTPPPQAQEGNRRPAKLRSSCDECAAAKVRCNKGQPECARCIAGGMTCIYGPSRKFGKPRKRAATQVDSEEEKSKGSRPGTSIPPESISMLHQNFRGQTHWDDIMQGSGSIGLRTPAWSVDVASMPGWNPFGQSNTTDFGITGAFNLGKDSTFRHDSLTEDTLMLEPPTSSSFDLDDCFQYLPSSFDSFQGSPFSSESLDTTPSLDQIQSSSKHASDLPGSASKRQRSALDAVPQTVHNCGRLAHSTLESLEFSPEKLKLFHGSPTENDPPKQSLDNVLSQNRTAISAVLDLLNCSCSRDPHLAMLYASITSKILIWYQVAAGCKKSSSWGTVPSILSTPSSIASTSSNDVTVSSTRPCSVSNQPPLVKSAGFSVAPVHITLGSFDLDEKDQEAFRKYLLLSELKKLGQAIEIFGGLGAGKDFLGGVADLYASLGGWLKSELARTVRVLKNGIEAADDF